MLDLLLLITQSIFGIGLSSTVDKVGDDVGTHHPVRNLLLKHVSYFLERATYYTLDSASLCLCAVLRPTLKFWNNEKCPDCGNSAEASPNESVMQISPNQLRHVPIKVGYLPNLAAQVRVLCILQVWRNLCYD